MDLSATIVGFSVRDGSLIGQNLSTERSPSLAFSPWTSGGRIIPWHRFLYLMASCIAPRDRGLTMWDSWYKRSELGTRVATFFTSATIAGAFSEYTSSSTHVCMSYGPIHHPRWSPGSRDFQHEWYCGKNGMVMDIHLGRPLYYTLCDRLVLDHPRFPGDGKISH